MSLPCALLMPDNSLRTPKRLMPSLPDIIKIHILLLGGVVHAQADDWPQFLGPNGNNISEETGLIDSFPKTGPKQIFSRRIGTGYSAPSIRDGKIVVFHRANKLFKVEEGDTFESVVKYLNNELTALKAKDRLTVESLKLSLQNNTQRASRGYIPLPQSVANHLDVEVIDCLDAKTGKLIWRHAYRTSYEDPYGYNNGPRCAPLLTKNRVYTYGAEGILLCLDFATGKQIWRRDTYKDFTVIPNFFGVGSTPILEGDLLLTMVGGQPNSGMVAFNARTGKTVWQSIGEKTWNGTPKLGRRGEPVMIWRGQEKIASYASPVIATVHGKRVAFCLMRQGLVALDPSSGKEYFKRWFRARENDSVNASNPVVIGNQVFFSSAYYGEGSFVLKIKKDLSGYTEVWSDQTRRIQADDSRLEEVLGLHWMTPIVYQGNIYAFSGRNEPDAKFRCVEFSTGKLLWSQDEAWQKYGPPSKKYGRGSFIQADGKLIVLGETGKFGLFELNAKKPVELASYMVPQLRYPCWAAPVMANKRIYLRSEAYLVCLDLAEKR